MGRVMGRVMDSERKNFCFGEDIDRRAVPALKTHPMVLGSDGENLFAAGVLRLLRHFA